MPNTEDFAINADRSPADGTGPLLSPTRLRLMRILAVFSLVITLIYLGWRLAFTLAPETLWMAVPFFLLEVHGAISLGLFIFSVWDIDSSTVPEPVAETEYSIAMLIPTYNEDPEVLLPTVSAAVSLEPAHETWVLDDGNREWVREMAESLGARYVNRPDNSHAKAGNLNHALELLDVDLVGILDADHVPSAGFLTNTLGYFEDEDLALVQTPQDFYNLDSFEHVGAYQEEAMFYRVIQPGKNRHNAAFWCGTSAVLRTEALRSVGGVATESLTEDLHTTMRFHCNGWKTIFHNEVLARGLAPASYLEYAVQRRRWGAGAMQILRSDTPFFKRGLTFTQRLSYAATLSGWFEGIRTLGYFVLSLAVVSTGRAPVDAPLSVFVPLYAAVFLSQQFAMLMMSRGRHSLGAGVMFDFFRLPASVRAVGRLIFPEGAKFLVTPKGRSGSERALGHLPSSLMFLTVVGLGVWAYFIATVLGYTPTLYKEFSVVAIALFFLVLNIIVLFASLGRATSWRFAAERRGAQRFEMPVAVQVAGSRAMLHLPSMNGGLVNTQAVPHSVDEQPLVLNAGQEVSVSFKQAGVTHRLTGVVKKTTDDGYAIGFTPGQWAEQGALSQALFTAQLATMPEGDGSAGLVVSFSELFRYEGSSATQAAAA